MMARIIFLIIFFTTFFGCQKKTEVVRTSIEVGVHDNMFINQYDTVIIGDYNSPVLFNIDLNNDRIDDIQFESVLSGSPQIGTHPRSMLRSLHENVKIYGEYNADTTFLNIRTTISNGTDSTIIKNEYYNYTCSRINSTDAIEKITPFKMSPLNLGDILNINDTFLSDTITLTNDRYGYQWKWDVNGDTIINKFDVYFNDCFEFPLDTTKYIGVKLNDEEKLGWIMIKILEKEKIRIIESGIQK
jgi:hypothetical protein